MDILIFETDMGIMYIQQGENDYHIIQTRRYPLTSFLPKQPLVVLIKSLINIIPSTHFITSFNSKNILIPH